MRSVLVINPKGGSGKTTLATNLAGALAAEGQPVYLWDLDRQRSSLTWLTLRPSHASRIRRLDQRAESAEANKGSWLVVDTPAGIHGKSLSETLRQAEKVLVPIQPSVFDMAATATFLQDLAEEKAVRKSRAFVGLVGMRVDARTRAAATLEAFLAQFDFPILSYLRDSQIYANAAFTGLTVFDLPLYMSERDREQWMPVLEWLDRAPSSGADMTSR
jgi:chromosome partitioning protein